MGMFRQRPETVLRNSRRLRAAHPLARRCADCCATTTCYSLGMKSEFDELFAFAGRRRPLPTFYGVKSSFRQQWAAPDDLGRLYFAVGSDCSLDLDGSRDLHLAGKLRIERCNAIYDFAT